VADEVLFLIESGEALGEGFRIALGEFGNGVDAGGFEKFAEFGANAVIWVSSTPEASASALRWAGVLALASSVSVSAIPASRSWAPMALPMPSTSSILWLGMCKNARRS